VVLPVILQQKWLSGGCKRKRWYYAAPLRVSFVRGDAQKLSSDDVAKLRREAGHWLKKLREARGLSQRDLAARVGIDYFTFISQLESGRGRIPPDRYRAWAQALGVEVREFVVHLMQFYDPITYRVLFGDRLPQGK